MKKIPKSYREATGNLKCVLTNDIMFIYLLQENYTFLLAFVCALLHLDKGEVNSLEITNRINIGQHINDKTFILDLRLLLNDNTLINIEMQVINYHDWPERSLGYLCRTFDSLNRGENYINTKPAIQISVLNFDPDNLPPEFYSTYKMMNVENHAVYTSKFRLSVLNLKHIDMATEEDKAYGIDKFANLFKATTWRDVQMLAQNNTAFAEAAETMYRFTADPELQYYYEKRQETLNHERATNALISGQEKVIAGQEKVIAENEKVIAENKKVIAENKKVIAENKKVIAENKKVIAENKKVIAEKDAEITVLQQKIKELEAQLKN